MKNPKIKQKGVVSESEEDDDDMQEVKGPQRRDFHDAKPYLSIEETSGDDFRITLLLPPFKLEELKQGYK